MDMIQYNFGPNRMLYFQICLIYILILCALVSLVHLFSFIKIKTIILDNSIHVIHILNDYNNNYDTDTDGDETESETESETDDETESETDDEINDDETGGPNLKEILLNLWSLIYLYTRDEAFSMNTLGINDIDENATNVIVSRDLHLVY